jgi:hypothetical protein
MFKIIYRILAISILSGSLVTQAFAQAESSTGIVTNADGTKQVTATKTLAGHKESTSMLNSVTMVGVGLVASRMYNYTPHTADTMLAAVGGGAFIFQKYNQRKKSMIGLSRSLREAMEKQITNN